MVEKLTFENFVRRYSEWDRQFSPHLNPKLKDDKETYAFLEYGKKISYFLHKYHGIDSNSVCSAWDEEYKTWDRKEVIQK